MTRKYILFDMDGVLLDSEAGSFGFMRETLSKRGIHIEMAALLGKIGKTSRQVAEELIREYNLTETAEEFLEKNRKMGNYYADSRQLCVMPGMYEFLELLKSRGIRMAVVSSTRAMSVLTALNRLSLISYMDAVVCGDMVKTPKPDPEGYLKAAGWLKAKPEECVVFEDSPVGIQAARNAGMRVVGFRGSELKQDTSEADFELDTYAECIRELDNILNNEI
ncbi:MAG: HAD family phosphatase [Eubacteriales bacterium]|nr:HAD family phosphatase [Eubacteriales bacterium]